MDINNTELNFILIVIIGLLLLLEVCYLIYHFIEKRHSAAQIFHRWGTSKSVSFSKEELAFIKQEAALYDTFLIDDITWNDLDMDTLYQQMNASMSSAGDLGLYRMLRCPVFREQEIKKRYAIQSWLLEHEEDRDKVRSALYKIGFQGDISLAECFTSQQASASLKFAYGMLALTLAAIVSLLFSPMGFLFPLLLLVVNYMTSYMARNRMYAQYDRMLYAYRYIRSLHALDRLRLDPCFEEAYDIHAYAEKLKSLQHSMFPDLHQGDSGILYIIAHFFYGEMIAYAHLNKKMQQHETEIRQVILRLQELDALLSAASYRSQQKTICEAMFHKEVTMQAIQMVHPLIEHPVANDVDLQTHCLISGSNTSGKSTYLKMIAINAIFAQSFGYAFATQYQACLFHVATSMALKDSLQEKDSYFVAEVRSIHRILQYESSEHPVLCMIDEILRGTNTAERISAASEILMCFVKTPSLCISATHDIELTSILSNHYRNLHFQEHIDSDQLLFDYHLYEGAGYTHNALRLLRTYGYDENVMREAEQLQKIYAETGRWVHPGKEVDRYGV